MFGDPLQPFINLEAQFKVSVDDQFFTETVSAVDAAYLGDGKVNAVLVLPCYAIGSLFFCCPVFLPDQVVFHAEDIFGFVYCGNNLLANRAVRVVAVHQGGEVGSGAPCCVQRFENFTFRFSQVDVLLKFFD